MTSEWVIGVGGGVETIINTEKILLIVYYAIFGQYFQYMYK